MQSIATTLITSFLCLGAGQTDGNSTKPMHSLESRTNHRKAVKWSWIATYAGLGHVNERLGTAAGKALNARKIPYLILSDLGINLVEVPIGMEKQSQSVLVAAKIGTEFYIRPDLPPEMRHSRLLHPELAEGDRSRLGGSPQRVPRK